eukprot:g20115.t1
MIAAKGAIESITSSQKLCRRTRWVYLLHPCKTTPGLAAISLSKDDGRSDARHTSVFVIRLWTYKGFLVQSVNPGVKMFSLQSAFYRTTQFIPGNTLSSARRSLKSAVSEHELVHEVLVNGRRVTVEKRRLDDGVSGGGADVESRGDDPESSGGEAEGVKTTVLDLNASNWESAMLRLQFKLREVLDDDTVLKFTAGFRSPRLQPAVSWVSLQISQRVPLARKPSKNPFLDSGIVEEATKC